MAHVDVTEAAIVYDFHDQDGPASEGEVRYSQAATQLTCGVVSVHVETTQAIVSVDGEVRWKGAI